MQKNMVRGAWEITGSYLSWNPQKMGKKVTSFNLHLFLRSESYSQILHLIE